MAYYFSDVLVLLLVVTIQAEQDVCKGHRCDTEACPCGCECGNKDDPGLCYVPKINITQKLPQQMIAVQGSGRSCQKPDWSCISVGDLPVPIPTAKQMLVEMYGASVNPINVDLVEPGCEHIPQPLGPCSRGALGNDGAGKIVSMGANCSGHSLGDEVWGFMEGTYAQYALADCDRVSLKPKSLSFVDAGTIPVVGGTSLQCLQALGLPTKRHNLTVVVTSGQGGTGFMGVQLAKALGAAHVITAASGEGINFVKALGADTVIDYHEQELANALVNDSVDLVFDNFGAKGTADKIMHAIRPGGAYLVLMGGNGGTISKEPKIGVRQIPFGVATAAKKEMEQLAQMFDDGDLQARTAQPVYNLDEVAAAFTRLRSSGVLGKISVLPHMKTMGAASMTTLV